MIAKELVVEVDFVCRYPGKKSSCSRSYLSAKSPQPFSAV